MTTYGPQGTVARMQTDGVDLQRLLESEVLVRTDFASETQRYWASGARPIHAEAREIMEVSFGSPRLLNHISFKASRFPMSVTAEWLDEDGQWQPLIHASDTSQVSVPTRNPRRREPVRLTISDSSPRVVKSDAMHRGETHWVQETWKTAPVNTAKVRIVAVRNPAGVGPVDLSGRPLPYSVAIGDLSFGYRVLSRYDLPVSSEGAWAASGDILGSRVGYSTYRQPPESALDGSTQTYWRSEPQPFSFSVVNLHLDMRTPEGEPQVVDRFWIDPITPGVLCNLYYSNDTEHAYFRGLSTPIGAGHEIRYGTPDVPVDGAGKALAIDLTPEEKTGVTVGTAFTRMTYDRPWWIGIDASTLAPATDATERPIASIGTTRIVQANGALNVVTQSGETVSLALDPALHLMRSRFALTVSHHPADAEHPKSRIRIAYRVLGHIPEVVTQDLLTPLAASPAPLGIGVHPSPGNDDRAALSVRGVVVKAEALTPEAEDWFFDEGEEFVADPATLYDDRGAQFNAVLRMHPDFVTVGNPFGIVGGANDPFDEMVWTPVPGDYVLRQGYMHVPPTKAAFWKFEMTGLLPEVYENFLTMDRDVLVFPHDVVHAYERAAGLADDNAVPPGVGPTASMESNVQYSDVRDAIDRSQVGINFEGGSDATEVLVVRDPVQAQRVATSGWVWSYQPWHSGSRAPRFATEQVHRYDRLRIRHSTKVGYFAGIREIEPYRVDYNFPDDTPEYVERLLDTTFIDLDQTSGVAFEPGGGIRTEASSGQITSGPMRSYRNVRGVQFATQESDMIQVLEDPDFNADNMLRWTEYGDAKIDRKAPGLVVVNRGWDPNTYGELEEIYDNYGEMDEETYAELEGLGPTGAAEGGIVSETYLPFGSGEVMARVHVSAPADLTHPIEVELVSAQTDEVWASSSRLLKAGESVTISVRAAGSGTMVARTYGEIETMVTPPTQYGEMEEFSYADLESAEGAATTLYVRVVQRGPSTDTFRVHRIALYDSPIAWFFSNDDGASWWQAVSVRNDPYSVLTFPEFFDTDDPEMGRTLRWRAKVYRAGATISALHIRPWYGVRGRTVDAAHGMELLGPNRNLRDLIPATHLHPMWQEVFNPIETVYVATPPTWRNLMPNPSAEGPVGSEWKTEGGTVGVAMSPLGTGLRSFEFTAGGDA